MKYFSFFIVLIYRKVGAEVRKINHMKKKIVITSLLGLAVLATIGAGTAQARGWMGMGGAATPAEQAQFQQEKFQVQANILGLSADEVKNAWAQGQTVRELAESKGISQEQLQQKMQETRQVQMKEHLQALVSQGVITQAQADQRLKFMQDNVGKMGKKGFGGHNRGMGMGI
jgi:hypothetical protein